MDSISFVSGLFAVDESQLNIYDAGTMDQPENSFKKRRVDHPVWEYFTITKINIRCNAKSCKTILSLPKSTTNAKKHLKNHPTLYKQYLVEEGKWNSSNGSLLSQKYHDKSARKIELDRKLALCLSIPSASFNLFSNDLFRDFIEYADPKYQMPKSFHGLKSLLKRNAIDVKTELKKILIKLPHKPSLTANIWTDIGIATSYLGITVHYISEENTRPQLNHALLGLKKFYVKTADNIRVLTEEILAEYGLELKSIFKITTDNGSNFKYAFKKADPISHYFEPEEAEEECEEDDDFEGEIPQVETTSEDENSKLLNLSFPKIISCFAHILQDVLFSTFKSSFNNDGFKKLCKLILKFGRNPEAKVELREKTGLYLIKPSLTRCDSWIDVISRYIKLEPFVRRIAERKGWEVPTEYELYFMINLIRVLEPFAEALKEFQAEKDVTFPDVYLTVKLLMLHLKKQEDEHFMDDMIMATITSLHDEMLKRCESIYNTTSPRFDPCYLIAAALDPKNSKLLTNAETQIAIEFARPLLSFTSFEEIPSQSTLAESQNEPKGVLGAYRAQLLIEQTRQLSGGSRDIVNTLAESFLAVRKTLCENPIAYWSSVILDFKPIKDLAYDILAIPATSAAIERVFSQPDFATTRHHSNMQEDFLNDQLIVYLNKALFP